MAFCRNAAVFLNLAVHASRYTDSMLNVEATVQVTKISSRPCPGRKHVASTKPHLLCLGLWRPTAVNDNALNGHEHIVATPLQSVDLALNISFRCGSQPATRRSEPKDSAGIEANSISSPKVSGSEYTLSGNRRPLESHPVLCNVLVSRKVYPHINSVVRRMTSV